MILTLFNPTPVPRSSNRDLATLEDEITELAAHVERLVHKYRQMKRSEALEREHACHAQRS
jgi:hypothetical protein